VSVSPAIAAKGSHGTLYYGSGLTTVKDRKKQIGPGRSKRCAMTSASTLVIYREERLINVLVFLPRRLPA
jgi:hypothetical protein